MSSMEPISTCHDLPPVKIRKFDGSPQRYPTFRHRFKQMEETRPLDDSARMTRLLYFLKGPALTAVQMYRFGQPFQVVRACVESLAKGPTKQANEKDNLQR